MKRGERFRKGIPTAVLKMGEPPGSREARPEVRAGPGMQGRRPALRPAI